MSLRVRQFFLRPQVKGFILKDLISGKHVLNQSSVKCAAKLPVLASDLELSLAALNINTIRTPPLGDPAKSRIPPPPPSVPWNIQLPQIQNRISYEEQTPNKTVEDPSRPGVLEKQAARLIVIRRRKMRKHKLKKLRKKMKFEWAKVRQRREMRKEKLFQAGLIEKIKLAEAFDPVKYTADKIAKSKVVDLPKHWHGVRYPEFIIKQLIEEKEAKEKEAKADEKRRASMSPYVKDYLKNLPKS
ncbi:uncharacterized protein LOC128990074 [Macrosteles quadrilineatus]|uniref:uncharacterized protein LOC128990074 n=1 Tax=Macrosteles quadrilineatus TaxID=74068 RepID=UPI0023E1A5B7|nr:uncharacterized protein LOC128990074 [Macrosteles quadrilineatus]